MARRQVFAATVRQHSGTRRGSRCRVQAFFAFPGACQTAWVPARNVAVSVYWHIGVSQGDVPALVIDPDPAQPRSMEKPDSGFSIRVADDGGLAAR